MIQNGGLAILLAWLLFAVLLGVLGFFVLRSPATSTGKSTGQASRRADRAG